MFACLHTQQLTGLLGKAAEYHLGGPLCEAAPDNPMGYFEREDFIAQNKEFMLEQNISGRNGMDFDIGRAMAAL